MSHEFTVACHRWVHGSDIPVSVTVEPIEFATGAGASLRKGLVHYPAKVARLTLGDEVRIVAAWICGATTVEGTEVDISGGEHRICTTCAIAAEVPSEPCVYRAYNADDELLYVGSTTFPPVRIRTHRASTRWWGEVARLTFEEYATEEGARAAETDAIWNEPGKYNRDGRKRSGPESHPLDGIAIDTAPCPLGGAA